MICMICIDIYISYTYIHIHTCILEGRKQQRSLMAHTSHIYDVYIYTHTHICRLEARALLRSLRGQTSRPQAHGEGSWYASKLKLPSPLSLSLSFSFYVSVAYDISTCVFDTKLVCAV